MLLSFFCVILPVKTPLSSAHDLLRPPTVPAKHIEYKNYFTSNYNYLTLNNEYINKCWQNCACLDHKCLIIQNYLITCIYAWPQFNFNFLNFFSKNCDFCSEIFNALCHRNVYYFNNPHYKAG